MHTIIDRTSSIVCLILIWTFVHIAFEASSQTCCSGGVPLSNSLGFGLEAGGTWQFMAGYDLNVMSTLKAGDETLDDNTRRRTTHSFLAQAGYTVNERFAVDFFVPYVIQQRNLTPLDQPADRSQASGIGDVVLMPKVRVFRQNQVGIGIKAPTGATDRMNDIGLVLSADLQPGTGSWDGIFWLNGTEVMGFRPSMLINYTASYKLSGTNSDYLGSESYQFGDEFQTTIGVADRFLLWGQVVDPSLSIKYRHVQQDVRNDFVLPSTGGSFLFLRPAVIYHVSDTVGIQCNIEVPLYAHLNGTQVTTSFRFNFSVVFKL